MDAADSADMLEDEKIRTQSVDLNTDTSLMVDISDALSERDRVKFTVHTKSTLPNFKESEFSVVREHEEFVWLHDRYVENEEYAGIIIPPAPPKPDFDVSREKLQKLGEGENSMTKEEFQKMKARTGSRVPCYFPRKLNFNVFLEFKGELNVRGKNKKERLGGLFKGLAKGVDEVLLSGQKDVDEFFETEKKFLVEYNMKLKDCTRTADRMTKSHKNVADSFIRISSSVSQMGTSEYMDIDRFLNKLAEYFEKARKLEGRVASDEDLKSSDLLRYYVRDTDAAKNLLYRRARCLADYENANKALDKARVKGKEVAAAETAQQTASEKFEHISEVAKQELTDFKTRRVQQFRKNMTERAELELKHAKAHVNLLKTSLGLLKEL
ncbi:Sorting nexin-5 [Desmophyllum pertusum]|uniref:Sorting nexin-5 n=1 Tax=Desmophyllum pertusum TaxID=174260 RepID=A0A9W9Z3L1_9CNID|nr:Sorting nexin-5 [Desmophyllum pertusum]